MWNDWLRGRDNIIKLYNARNQQALSMKVKTSKRPQADQALLEFSYPPKAHVA